VGVYKIIWEFLAVACHCKSYHVGCKFGICREEWGPVHVLKKAHCGKLIGIWSISHKLGNVNRCLQI
jgi:hypothetical protein